MENTRQEHAANPAGMPVETPEDLERIIASIPAVLLYFSTPGCNVCQVLKPKVKQLLREKYPAIAFYYINCTALPEVAARFSVFAVPTLLVCFDGRETIRKSRYLGIDELDDALRRPFQLFFG